MYIKIIRGLLIATVTVGSVYLSIFVYVFISKGLQDDRCIGYVSQCDAGKQEAEADFAAGRARLYLFRYPVAPWELSLVRRLDELAVQWDWVDMGSEEDFARMWGYNTVASRILAPKVGVNYMKRLRWEHTQYRMAQAHNTAMYLLTPRFIVDTESGG